MAAILWHQGEGDCGDLTLRETYRARFEAMIAALKDACGLADVPVILGGLGDFLPAHNEAWYGGGNKDAFNGILKKMAEETPLMGYVSAEGLTANPDLLHFNAPSLHAFGLRYFAAYEATRDPQRIFTTAPETDEKRSAMEAL